MHPRHASYGNPRFCIGVLCHIAAQSQAHRWVADLELFVIGCEQLHVGQGFVGAHRAQRHSQRFDFAQRQAAFGKQTIAQALWFVDAQINQYAAAARLCAGADALDLGEQQFCAVFNLKLGDLAELYIDGIACAHGHFDFELAQIDHLQHLAVNCHALAGLCRTNCDLP